MDPEFRDWEKIFSSENYQFSDSENEFCPLRTVRNKIPSDDAVKREKGISPLCRIQNSRQEMVSTLYSKEMPLTVLDELNELDIQRGKHSFRKVAILENTNSISDAKGNFKKRSDLKNFCTPNQKRLKMDSIRENTICLCSLNELSNQSTKESCEDEAKLIDRLKTYGTQISISGPPITSPVQETFGNQAMVSSSQEISDSQKMIISSQSSGSQRMITSSQENSSTEKMITSSQEITESEKMITSSQESLGRQEMKIPNSSNVAKITPSQGNSFWRKTILQRQGKGSSNISKHESFVDVNILRPDSQKNLDNSSYTDKTNKKTCNFFGVNTIKVFGTVRNNMSDYLQCNNSYRTKNRAQRMRMNWAIRKRELLVSKRENDVKIREKLLAEREVDILKRERALKFREERYFKCKANLKNHFQNLNNISKINN